MGWERGDVADVEAGGFEAWVGGGEGGEKVFTAPGDDYALSQAVNSEC